MAGIPEHFFPYISDPSPDAHTLSPGTGATELIV